MDADQMLKTIEVRADLRSRDEALQVAGAVLSVLGERLAGGEPANLASQLPVELAGALPRRGAGEPFAVDEFDRRVAEREMRHRTPAEAHRHAVAVLTTVLGSVSAGERDGVAAQLPADYDDFLPAGTPIRGTGMGDGRRR